MSEKTLPTKDFIYYLVVFAIFSYLISIFAVNLNGRVLVNYDIYSDAILAKYMWQTKSFFPDGWHFGNQIYTVATPAVAAILYGIVNDAYLALALASCFMTLGIILSYIWCLKPFVNVKSIIVSLLVVIGGTNISFTAHGDWEGFQLFYTMASYYACYVIGIFITLGAFLRLTNHMKTPIVIQLFVLIYNFALGMQSLRELLVLNLPLCVLVVLNMFLHCNSLKKEFMLQKQSSFFVFLTLTANICGVFITKILVSSEIIKQTTIISSVGSNIWHNFKLSMLAFWDYIGLSIPTTAFELFELVGAIFSILVITLSLTCIIIDYIKNKKISTLGYINIFFVISLLAVFCAGLIIIYLRDIYFFCWHFLVATSVTMLIEKNFEKNPKLWNTFKYILIACLLGISLLNYKSTFYLSLKGLSDIHNIYKDIVNQLQEDNIQYLYSDWRTERNKLSAMAYDDIQYGTLEFSGNPNDLWLDPDCLYYEDWFEPNNFDHAYIILSDYTLYCLEIEFSEEYRNTLMNNLEYVYSFSADGEELHFYIGSEKLYADMIH